MVHWELELCFIFQPCGQTHANPFSETELRRHMWLQVALMRQELGTARKEEIKRSRKISSQNWDLRS